MENFVQYNPTKVIFGREVADQLPGEISWKKALVVIGESSAKKNGLYARVVSLMNMAGLEHITHEGVKASASYLDADEAVKKAKAYLAEVIIAIGGCSAIDVAKAAAIGYYSNHSVWDFYMLKEAPPQKALPVLNILTIASTGSAMNNNSVLSDPETGIKKEFSSPLFYPKAAFLDPYYSVTVPARQTAFGVSTMIAYAIQQFLNEGDAPLTDYFTADLVRLAIQNGKEVMQNLQDYQLRANLMWMATLALNDTLSNGRNYTDKSISSIAFALDMRYEIGHGASLAIVLCAWLKYHQYRYLNRIRFLAKHIFASESFDYDATANGFVKKLEDFYQYIGVPVRLSQAGIGPTEKQQILQSFQLNKITVNNYKMADKDYEALLELMW
ncbi:iron-containing alcohol dehydrogenase [Mucilaginibacter arboris]|uniref:Iron-containing alcohol dehydrogenase n=1 Tax=Mucilaginibacter arboris TaxID=2682090 RepID=A0A7K1SYV7_9SPHI|nr:iron-containing alcohol dehydrogenase [Mucilaginibacter arboris]MVN22506.1 iron-containing alcohol dehydrogenase [Mucilaginibacter arboris]